MKVALADAVAVQRGSLSAASQEDPFASLVVLDELHWGCALRVCLMSVRDLAVGARGLLRLAHV